MKDDHRVLRDEIVRHLQAGNSFISYSELGARGKAAKPDMSRSLTEPRWWGMSKALTAISIHEQARGRPALSACVGLKGHHGDDKGLPSTGFLDFVRVGLGR